MAYRPSLFPFAFAPLLAVACGGADTNPVSTGGHGGSPPPPVHAEPPAAGPPHAPDGQGSTTFAIRRLFLGDTDPDGTPDPANGWKHWGFDLDGVISLQDPDHECKPHIGLYSSSTFRDGDDGIDNAFGREALPLLLALSSKFTEEVNDSLAAGGTTLLFDLEKLGAGADYNPLEGRLYLGAPLGKTPAGDGSDVWPVRTDSLADPLDPASAKVRFPAGYVVDNRWVGHADGAVRLVLTGAKLGVELPIEHAVVTMKLDADHQQAVSGVIAGRIPLRALYEQAARAGVSAFGASACSQEALLIFEVELARAADILADGSQDPARTCDALSIGIGFEAVRVTMGSLADPPPPADPPCACDAAATCASALAGGSWADLCATSDAFDAFVGFYECGCETGTCNDPCSVPGDIFSCAAASTPIPAACLSCLEAPSGCADAAAICQAH